MPSSMTLRSSMSPGGAEFQEMTPAIRKRRTSLISPSQSAEQTQQLLSKGGRGDAVNVVDSNKKGDKKEVGRSNSEEENSESGDEDFDDVDDQQSVVWYIVVFVIFVLIPFALLFKMYMM